MRAAAGGAAPWPAFAAILSAYFASIGFFSTYAPLWYQGLGYSALAIGAISSLQAWTRIGVPYAWGWLADHTGRKVMLLRIAAALTLVFGSLLYFSAQASWLPLCVFLLYLFNGGVVPLSESALARYLRTDTGVDTGRYGQIRVWGSIGFIVSAAAGGLVLEALGMKVFPVALMLLLALLCIATWRLPSTVDHSSDKGGTPPPVWPVLRRPEVRWFFITVFFTVLAHTSLYTFFSLYLDSLGYGKTAVGLLWSVSAFMEILYFWQGSVWLRGVSPVRWLWWAAVLCVLRFAATAGAGQYLPVLVLAQMLHAVTFAAQHSSCIALIAEFFPGRLRARGQGLYAILGYGLSGVLGALGGGYLTEHLGFASVFWAATASSVVAALCCRRLMHHLNQGHLSDELRSEQGI